MSKEKVSAMLARGLRSADTVVRDMNTAYSRRIGHGGVISERSGSSRQGSSKGSSQRSAKGTPARRSSRT